ncbi:hypothetical protein DUY81_03900 [Acidipropionibacterium acidipropionici]|uniref:Uncharacterized protein n=1 Tax=Acidipropionibacterium acidipropionici TaxID=1748 RepID=A0AAC9ANF2_9ACTN|nr:hypothetical protein AXH35_07845 [Acidipropionibacterium acidipropionici]AOZ46855.1 hypothetical protein A8L58_09300 [Acidipropionibacterium acidipropionici]AZP37062.1 hypothetical protein DUY81_03900 [Acidipropionibacterium acidipropionici]
MGVRCEFGELFGPAVMRMRVEQGQINPRRRRCIAIGREDMDEVIHAQHLDNSMDHHGGLIDEGYLNFWHVSH